MLSFVLESVPYASHRLVIASVGIQFLSEARYLNIPQAFCYRIVFTNKYRGLIPIASSSLRSHHKVLTCKH